MQRHCWSRLLRKEARPLIIDIFGLCRKGAWKADTFGHIFLQLAGMEGPRAISQPHNQVGPLGGGGNAEDGAGIFGDVIHFEGV